MLDGAFRRERGGSDITPLGKRGVRAVGVGVGVGGEAGRHLYEPCDGFVCFYPLT